jgi:hypothetical protein
MRKIFSLRWGPSYRMEFLAEEINKSAKCKICGRNEALVFTEEQNALGVR